MAETSSNESKGEPHPPAPQAPLVTRLVRRYRARLFQGYVGGAILGFAVLFFLARRIAYFEFDLVIAHWLQQWHTTWLDMVMQGVSQLGYNPFPSIFIGLTTVLVFIVGLKWESVMLLVAGIGIGLLNEGVKLMARRQRPTPDLVNVFIPLEDFSFPSGHVLMFTAFLGFLLFLIFTLLRRSWVRKCGLGVLGTLIALVGVSRVYLGVHWPSDVLGAYLLGSLWLVLLIFLYRKGKPHFFVHQPLAPEIPVAAK